MPKIRYSIIIPHHNIPELLQRCLDSIPKRDDIQIIVVDDNSDCGIVDFGNFPGKDDNNVEIYFSKEGRGAGHARNVGLGHAVGEWLIFSDADDYFDTKNLNELMDTDYSDYEVVSWQCEWIKSDRVEIIKLKSGNKASSDDLFYMNEPWRKMVKRSFIEQNSIRFQESMVSNDLMYSMKVASACKRVYWHDKTIYYWVQRENSLSNGYKGRRLYAALNVSIDVNAFLKSKGIHNYYDRTGYYLSLVWKESPLKYWKYLLKVYVKLGKELAFRFNKEVSDTVYISPKISTQIFDYIIVELGSLKRKIKN